MAYFVMTCEGVDAMPIASRPDLNESWMLGRHVDPSNVPSPLAYTLDADYGGDAPKAMYASEAIPVMRDDVARVLTDAGVDNIQYFDAVLVDVARGKTYRDYKAFNILGLVAAADRTKSTTMGTSDSDIGDLDFDGLVIDESKTHGLLLFRLAESVNAIVVHERVKDAIEAGRIPGFVFYGPGEWSG